MAKAPTIVDVAEAAGVSTSTVSRFLRGEQVQASDRIRRVVDNLRYRPSPAAQHLKSGRTGAVALVVPDVMNPFFAAVARGAMGVAAEDGHTVLIAHTDESGVRERAAIEALVGRVDGLVLAPADEDAPGASVAEEAGLPVVLLDRLVERGSDHEAVLVDNHGGARAATQHLLQHGHRRIATIAGLQGSTPGRLRLEGHLGALAAAGVEVPDELVQTADFTEHGGYQAMLRLIALNEPPTAVFVANNLMTLGALHALRDLSVRVPDDCSIVGFDGHTFADLLSPPLTVVDRPMEDQGALAMRMLAGRLREGRRSPARQVVLETTLIERGSCAPPPRGPRQ